MIDLEGVSDGQVIHRKAVAVVCDARFFPYAVCLALQIERSHPIRQFDVVVVCSSLVEWPATLRSTTVRLVRLQGDNPFAHLSRKKRRSHAAYLCLMLPHLLPEYERIAYFDCDMHVVMPSLDDFLELDLRSRAVGAVRDIAQWRTPGRRPKEMISLNRQSVPYFNSGAMLIDCDRWRVERVSEKCVAAAGDPSLRDGLVRDDQSVINLALEGRWCELSPVWNWQWTWTSRLFADPAGARMIHFIGPRKPWNSADVPLRYSHGYPAFLAQHFPDRNSPAIERRSPALRDIGRVLIRHRLRLNATQVFLSKFSSAFTTYAH